MSLELDVIIVAHEVFPPFDALLGLFHLAAGQQARHLAAQTCRADYKPLVVGRNLVVVGAGVEIEAFGPGFRHKFDEVAVAGLVFGEHDQVAAGVAFVRTVGHRAFGHIHFAAYDGCEHFGLQLGYLRLDCPDALAFGRFRAALQLFQALFRILDGSLGRLILFVDVVYELLDAVHHAMVGDCHAGHAVGHGFVDNGRDGRLPVKERVLTVDVKVYEFAHCSVSKIAASKVRKKSPSANYPAGILSTTRLFYGGGLTTSV